MHTARPLPPFDLGESGVASYLNIVNDKKHLRP